MMQLNQNHKVKRSMAYILTPEQMASITEPERVFATERLLPAWEDIPVEFKRGNIYTELASAIFYSLPMPACTLEMKEGFEANHLNVCVRAHLKSFLPKHEHKIAGVGYMISLACTAEPETEPSE